MYHFLPVSYNKNYALKYIYAGTLTRKFTSQRQESLSIMNQEQNKKIDAIADDLERSYNTTESHLITVDDALQELKHQDDMIKLELSRNVVSPYGTAIAT